MMKHNRILHFCTAVLSLIFCACADDDSLFRVEPAVDSKTEINLQASIDQVNPSRANDSGFADGDRIGVYAVNFTDNGKPGTLSASGNLATNIGYTFHEQTFTWTGDRQLYFKDDKTPVDFYGYYPFNNTISDINAHSFAVERNQATDAIGRKLSAYEASDFLWAKTPAVLPSTPLVSLTFRHILASVQVTLIEGTGFEPGEWAGLDKSVIVSNTGRNATIDLATGKVTLTGNVDIDGIVANPYKDNYRAIVIPQTVEAGKTLLAITVDGQSYAFSKEAAMTYMSAKMHKFTIEVNKRELYGDFEFTLVDESITVWESDLVSHNGKVKEYIVVDVPSAGGLKEAVEAAGLNPEEIINLKITGELTASDFSYIRGSMKYLEALNLKEVILRRCSLDSDDYELYDYTIPHEACTDMRLLSTVVFPDKLVKIGGGAFRNTNLTGSLDFPEGLEYIGGNAFSNWQSYTESNTNLSGTLTLPSTLKYIGSSAFENCDFTGPLILPEGLEYIGGSAFSNCKNMTGELHLPSTLKELGEWAFANMKGLTGSLIIPRHITEIKPYGAPGLRKVVFPDAPTSIANEAFINSSLSGDIIIPETVTNIGERAFFVTRMSHIVFPQNLEFIENEVCCGNIFLQDTIVIPPLIETIGERAFAGCEKLEAVILPKKLQRIKNEAFYCCYSLNYIYCQAVEPPVLEENAFYGVAKDNFTVEVPEESVDAYRNAPGWKDFKRISSYRNFVARPSKYNVLNKGGKKEIILNADTDWELTECPDWCQIDKTSGSKKTVITLTVSEMPHNQGNRTGIISFRLKDSEENVTHINVGQYDYEHEEDGYLQLQQATKGGGVDLFFCGDGYDAIDISSGLYLEDMKKEMEYFFAVEPYTTYRDYFNVYTSFALSEDSGVETLNNWRNTKFHTCLGDGKRRLSADWEAAMNYCVATIPPIANRPEPKVGVVLLANTELYEGITYSIGDNFCAVVTKSTEPYPSDARGIVQHEAGGHGIGRLADEYIYHVAFIQKCTCTCCDHVDGLKEEQANGFGLNLSLTGKYKEVPWSHLIFHQDYGDIVDIYEGGYFHSRGVYRSEYNSCMNNNVPYFSTWSRQLIVQRIMHLAGETFDFERFVANDKRTMGQDFMGFGRGTENISTPARHGNPPIHITNFKFGMKGGKR